MSFSKSYIYNKLILKDNKKLWEQISAKNQQLNKLNELKTDFVNNVAHELRTPLTIIKGYIENLADGIMGELNPAQKDALNTVLEVTSRLANMVNTLLDLAKIEAGKMELNREKVNFSYLVMPLVKQFLVLADKKNITFTYSLPLEPIEAWCDKEKISQVITNFLSNAFKFTPSGGKVHLECSSYGKFIKLSVQDTGKGIPKDKIGKIFNKFESLAQASEKSTGLGLPISFDIIKLHKGEIFVESQEGKGAKFTFIIPVDLRNQER